MFVEQPRTPTCTVQVDKRKPACGREMFRVGPTHNYVWACPECDRIDPATALDSPE